MAKVMEIDVATSEITERDMTAEELADYQARQDEASANQEE